MVPGRKTLVIKQSLQSSLLRTASSPKRILFVLPDSAEFGGLEKHLLELIEMLLRHNTQVAVLCFGPDIFTERFENDWHARVSVVTKAEPKAISGWISLFQQLRSDTVVFCYGWIDSFPWQATLAAMVAGIRRRFAIQHLVLPPLPPPPKGKGLKIWLRRRIGQRARRLMGWRAAALLSTKTICVSDAVRDSLVSKVRFPPRRTITVHNGVSTLSFTPSKENGLIHRSRLALGEEEFVLVCAARLSEAKGIDILLRAVSGVVRRGVQCTCVVVGDGPLRDKLLKQVDDLKLSSHVRFVGFQKDVRPYLQCASAFILTSHLEGLPLAVLEAMACGVPCIVTNVGGSAEAVKQGINGLVIEPGSVEEAEKAIVHLATHEQECIEMAKNARRRACESFDIESQMKILVEVILS